MASCVLCNALATVYCEADRAFLCFSCDKTIHEANMISRSHRRLPVCALCKRSAAAVFCKEDDAALCSACEVEVHSANPLPHTVVSIAQHLACASMHGLASLAPVDKALEVHEDEHSCSAVGDSLSSGLLSLAVVPDAGQVSPQPATSAANKSAWAKDLDALDLEAAWLGNLDMGLDLADFLADAEVPGLVPSVPQAKPIMSPAPAVAFDDLFSLTDDFPAVTSFLPEVDDTDLPIVGTKRTAADALVQVAPSAPQRHKTDSGSANASYAIAPPPPPFAPAGPAVEVDAMRKTLETKAASSPPAATALMNGANLTREQRVARYREKRKNRKFTKTIRYASRKAYAEVRPRIKGRFATKEEVQAYNARKAAGIVGPEDHLMIFS